MADWLNLTRDLQTFIENKKLNGILCWNVYKYVNGCSCVSGVIHGNLSTKKTIKEDHNVASFFENDFYLVC